MKKKYFGTDGIRGEANKDLTPELAMKLGFALGYYLKKKYKTQKANKYHKVLIGEDTRVSCEMLKASIVAGLSSMGVNIDVIGVIPTPGVAYLTKKLKADAGIMISASHNMAKDNGIKIFNNKGYKLSDEKELELEKYIDDFESIKKHRAKGDEVGQMRYSTDDSFLYQEFLLSIPKTRFDGLKIILDTANGAAFSLAPKIFSYLGAEVVAINNIPSGKNINVKCGSTDITILKKVVLGYNADLGLAYDGDADRLLAVDNKGNLIDGDKIMSVIGEKMKKEGKLNNNHIAATVMTNLGIELQLKKKNIDLIKTKVGDRYVLETMITNGLNLGGEQSGHIIFLDHNTTGDGILTSLKLVDTIIEEKKSLEDLTKKLKEFPQILVNVKVNDSAKKNWEKNKKIQNIIDKNEKKLKNKGRILVRASGTEPLIRIMVEGQEKAVINQISREIKECIDSELN